MSTGCLTLKHNFVVNIPTVKLNNGIEMPVLGIGTWLGLDDKENYKYEDFPKLVETLSYAIDAGYRHIDTAHFYRVEPEVGIVINQKINEGVVKREDLFITTKVWQHSHREVDVITSIKASLRRLSLDYLDQALIHWPMSITLEGVDEKIDYLETWRGFEKALAMGLTKSIGVSNFNVKQLKRLLAFSKVPPATNQIEIHINLGQKDLVDYCQSHNIVVVAYTPFGTMTREEPGSPEPKVNHPTMVAISKKHGKTATQIVLRYLYQRGLVSIPKTISKPRIIENASIFDFNLDEDDVKTLAEFDVNYRINIQSYWQFYEHYPFKKIPGAAKEELPELHKAWKNGVNANID